MPALRLLIVAIALLATGCGESNSLPDPASQAEKPAVFVGRQECARCHEEEDDLWEGSHHDLAMQEAHAGTVLGDFDDTTFTHFGVTSTFTKTDDQYFVMTDGPDGTLTNYQVKYAFGVTPLQQYLIEFPGGRLQPLAVSWDSRPKEMGGQRWFHLYPDEAIPHDDALHWTGPNQNWNFMCAECHSTNLRSSYDVEKDSYTTSWSEINVSCEACHGPGSRHVEWADRVAARKEREPGYTHDQTDDMGLPVDLKRLPESSWVIDAEGGTAKRKGPPTTSMQIETCGRCHSRRTLIWNEYEYGRPLLDTHRISLLEEGLYHADGKILEEVYVYGSFLQSRMYHQGVVCTDCHLPHGPGLRTTGNGLCFRCHHPETFDKREHHKHEPGTPATQCTACHMPSKLYMVVDPRLDHSMRIPRPDLSVELGTPNACSGCHSDKSVEWAAEATARWYGTKNRKAHFGRALHAGRERLPNAPGLLLRLVADEEQPAIARATGLVLLGRLRSQGLPEAVRNAASHKDPLLRLGAARTLDAFPMDLRLTLGFPLVKDDVRSVRLEAARHLAEVPASIMTSSQRTRVENAIEEYLASQEVNADRAWAHVNRGNIHTVQREFKQAESAFRTALRINPDGEPPWVNLADLYRTLGQDDRAEATLKEGLKRLPDGASLHHALGLALVRLKRSAEALGSLARAVSLRPEEARYAYVYGVALSSMGRREEAVLALESGARHNPGAPNIIYTLATILRDMGHHEQALRHARALLALQGKNPRVQALIREIEGSIRK